MGEVRNGDRHFDFDGGRGWKLSFLIAGPHPRRLEDAGGNAGLEIVGEPALIGVRTAG